MHDNIINTIAGTMDDWKLKAEAVVIIKEKRNVFVLFLILLNNFCLVKFHLPYVLVS